VSPHDGFIGLGSNLGEPPAQIARSLELLFEGGVSVGAVSSLYETEPIDAPHQPWFVNGVARVASPFSPRALLGICQEVEARLGRRRDVHHGPRTIDLDLLMVGDAVEESAELTLPHPELHRRRFVLVPFAEIAGSVVHPRLGLTVTELLERCPDRGMVRFLAPPVR